MLRVLLVVVLTTGAPAQLCTAPAPWRRRPTSSSTADPWGTRAFPTSRTAPSRCPARLGTDSSNTGSTCCERTAGFRTPSNKQIHWKRTRLRILIKLLNVIKKFLSFLLNFTRTRWLFYGKTCSVSKRYYYLQYLKRKANSAFFSIFFHIAISNAVV